MANNWDYFDGNDYRENSAQLCTCMLLTGGQPGELKHCQWEWKFGEQEF